MSLRNSLLKCDIFRNEKIAEEQVVNVLDFDIHMSRDYSGKRYISRITEIIPLQQVYELPDDYKGKDFETAVVNFMDTVREYYRRKTEYKTYMEKDIIVFEDGEYVLKNKISDLKFQKMKAAMIEEDAKEFEFFHSKFDAAILEPDVQFENLNPDSVEYKLNHLMSNYNDDRVHLLDEYDIKESVV